MYLYIPFLTSLVITNYPNFQAHKCVLIARSPVFEALLLDSEMNQNQIQININSNLFSNFDYETVEIALELMYDRKMSTLTMKQKMDVLLFFDEYDVQLLTVCPELVYIKNYHRF